MKFAGLTWSLLIIDFKNRDINFIVWRILEKALHCGNYLAVTFVFSTHSLTLSL